MPDAVPPWPVPSASGTSAAVPDPVVLEATVRLAQPAALGRDPRGIAPIDSHRHIPGSVLRGALAAAWIREYGPPQHAGAQQRADFLHLFEGPVRYGPLFDASSEVVPLSVLRCKYQPEPDCRDFTFDEATQDTEPAVRPRCACEGRTEPSRGDVEFFTEATAPPVLAQATRVALTADERAADGQLFTRRALTAHTGHGPRTLTGGIAAPDRERAAWLLREHELRLGGRRSTSGAAVYLPAEVPRVLPDPAVLAAGRRLIVRLTSPAILVDAAGRPSERPDPALLGGLLGFGGTPVEIERSWTRREPIGGWHALTNLPKPTEVAVSAGSVYRVLLPGQPDPYGLARLVDQGLGLRRAEGFGWIALGPWTPRTIDTPPSPAASPEQRAKTFADELHRLTGQTAWLADKLRACLLGRRRGNPPDAGFLDTPRAETLHRLREGHLRDQLEELVAGDLTELEKVVLHLDALARTERQR